MSIGISLDLFNMKRRLTSQIGCLLGEDKVLLSYLLQKELERYSEICCLKKTSEKQDETRSAVIM